MIYGYTKDRKKAWEIIEKLGLCSEQESKVQFTMADRKINAVVSTSVGRLFDAVSAILGIRLNQGLKEKHRQRYSLQQKHMNNKIFYRNKMN